MELLKGLVSYAFFFHARLTIKFIKSSNLLGPYQYDLLHKTQDWLHEPVRKQLWVSASLAPSTLTSFLHAIRIVVCFAVSAHLFHQSMNVRFKPRALGIEFP
jgi:hypothetical protein